ncbi:MAG: DUF4846 domain-containing protein [Bacteroidia bacterium]
MKTIQAGDVFITGGSPGHACIVMNVAKNDKTGEVLFILAQSYMPAQEIHVLKNFSNQKTSPWYSINFGNKLETPQWDFYSNQLMRFKE